jgi:hypothetical protein
MGQILSDVYDSWFGDATNYWETNPANSIFVGEQFALRGQLNEDEKAFTDEMNAFSPYF